MIDMVKGYLEQWESDGLRMPELMDWLRRFHDDKQTASRDYWNAVSGGIRSAFNAGPEAIPDNPTPGQLGKNRLDK